MYTVICIQGFEAERFHFHGIKRGNGRCKFSVAVLTCCPPSLAANGALTGVNGHRVVHFAQFGWYRGQEPSRVAKCALFFYCEDDYYGMDRS